MIEKIISGGQTGVDQAALQVAIELNIQHGGWCPKGRIAENGTIPSEYLLKETESDDYNVRTKLNVKDADGTLILVSTKPIKGSAGTILTIRELETQEKPFLIVELSKRQNIGIIVNWITKHNIKNLNIAGPRESQSPGINTLSRAFLRSIMLELRPKNDNQKLF